MAQPPTFVMRTQNASDSVAYRLLAGTSLSQFPSGATIGTSQVETLSQRENKSLNRLVEFKNDVFAFLKADIYEVDLDAGSWGTPVHSVTGGNTIGSNGSLLPISINGVPSLIGTIDNAPGTSMLYFTYDETNGWVDKGSTSGSAAPSRGETYVYQDILFGGGTHLWWLDPSLASFSSQNVSGSGEVSFAVHKGYLYAMINFLANPTYWYIYRFTGAGWAGLGYVGAASLSGNRIIPLTGGANRPKSELVSFDGALYAFCWGKVEGSSDIYGHLEVFKYVATGNTINLSTDESRLTSTVSFIPTQNSSVYDSAHINAFVDYDTDPANPVMYFFVNLRRESSSWRTYQWNGDSSVITLVGGIVGGATGLAPSLSKDGGGERIWTAGSTNVTIQSRAAGNGGLKYTFTADGDPLVLTHGAPSGGTGFEEGETVQDQTTLATGTIVRVNSVAQTLEVGAVSGTFGNNVVQQTTGGGSGTQATVSGTSGGGADYKVQQLHNNEEEPPTTQGTIKAGSVAGGSATLNGNWIENIVADSLTVYTFVWNFFNDGFQPGERSSDKLDLQPE